MITYPDINEVAVSVGPLKIHWYGLMYVIGFITTWLLLRRRALQPASGWEAKDAEDLVFFGMVGLFVGARIFYMLVYGSDQLVDDPLAILRIWEGGMSFHGGLIGVTIAMIVFARRRQRGFFEVTDFLVPAVSPGLFFGRMGNFINGELWGKATTLPWGFVWDGDPQKRPDLAAVFADGQARHPSQLYEALLEGLVLFLILWVFSAKPRPTMAVSGLFLLLYGVFRFSIEFVRVPDAHMGYLAFGWLTTGQLLTLPMVVLGAVLIGLAYRRGVYAKRGEPETAS